MMKKFLIVMVLVSISSVVHASSQKSVQNAWNDYFSGVTNECFSGVMTLPNGKSFNTAWICAQYGNNPKMLGFRGSKIREQGFLISGTKSCRHYLKPYNKERALSKSACNGAILSDADPLTVKGLHPFMEFQSKGRYTVGTIRGSKKEVITSIQYAGTTIELGGITWVNGGKNWRPKTMIFKRDGKSVTIQVGRRTFNSLKCSLTKSTLKSGGRVCKP